MIILVDIGGTYARFAQGDGTEVSHIEKYEAANFARFDDALAHYCAAHNIERGGLRIATAAYPDAAGHWRFVNNNQWVIEPNALRTAGWDLQVIMNDFEAATRGLLDLPEASQGILKAGAPGGGGLSKCLSGPGTGLGLGYLREDGAIQKTHGGHMLATTIGDEQRMIVEGVQKIKRARGDDTVAVFENFISGGGLYNIYAAHCAIESEAARAENAAAILGHLDEPSAQNALRLFHEFFGLFAHGAVVTGHAYGGLYLTGGVMDHLVEHGLFDLARFEQFFVLAGVTSVQAALDATPIIYVRDPYLSLRGLLNYA